jgi:H+/Cl- antiporter ClcA
MAMILVWIVLPVVFTLFGFYLGTFVVSQHVQDLQGGDIDKGVFGAVAGFGLSVIFGLVTTSIYPKVIEAEYVEREAGHSSGHH